MISVLVPAYNEANTIVQTIESIRGALPSAEIVVIDDGSRDATAGLACSHGAIVVRHRHNRGKAQALWTGAKNCRGNIVAMVDADMGHRAREIEALVEAVKSQQCELAIAGFATSQGGGLGLVRNLARWGIFIFTRRKFTTPLSGQRAATRDLMLQCLPSEGGFGLETEFTIRALNKGYRVKEIPTDFIHQGQGWTLAGFGHRGRQLLDVLAALVRGGLKWRQS